MGSVERSLPRRNALLFAAGAFSTALVTRVFSTWLLFFYATAGDAGDTARRMPVWLAGAILTVTGIVGAFNDPLIGFWSDRTSSRWGRRIPFIVLGTPLWVLLFVLLWTPPVAGESAVNAAYFLAMVLLFRFFATVANGPYDALLPEIAPTNLTRVRVVVGQVLFATIGAALALTVAGPLIDLLGFQLMALIVALVALVVRFVGLAGTWRYVRRDVPPVDLKLFGAFRAAFRNDQFLAFLPTFVLFSMAITLLTAALPFYVRAVLQAGEDRVGRLSGLMSAVPIAVLLLSLPLIHRLALRWGKARVYSLAMLVGAAYLPVLFFMGTLPGVSPLLQGLLFMAPVGLAMAGVLVFPNALMADIIDYDALHTGQRREGIYYAAQNLVENLAVALHSLILAGLLQLGSTPDNSLGVRLVGPVAGLSILVGYLIFRRYSLPDTVTPDTVPHAAGGGVERGAWERGSVRA